MSSQLWWYSARAGGIVAWVLLTVSTLWGLVLSTKLRPPRVRPVWTLDLHRFLGELATIFVGVHVASIMLDSYTHFGVSDVLVPFAASWHPLWVAWGIVGFYLLLAVELSSLARRYLPNQLWRRLHFLSFVLFIVATVHFLMAGTDMNAPAVQWAVLAGSVAVGAMTTYRVVQAVAASRQTAAQPAMEHVWSGSGTGR